MKALLNFDGGDCREVQPETNDEVTEVHDILLDRLRRIAALRPDDKNFQNEIIKARAVCDLAEVTIKHDMLVVAVNRLANSQPSNIKLPKFLLG